MIFFINNQLLNQLIPDLQKTSLLVPYKHMYYNPNNATSSSIKKDQIKTELQQFGVKEGSLDYNICHQVCNLFRPSVDIRTIGFVKVAPNMKIGKHVDNKTNRSSVLSIPLYPSFEDYAHVTFYDFKVEWQNLPFFMPTEKYHSVENNNHTRINFQLGFGYDIETIHSMYKNNELFL